MVSVLSSCVSLVPLEFTGDILAHHVVVVTSTTYLFLCPSDITNGCVFPNIKEIDHVDISDRTEAGDSGDRSDPVGKIIR